MNRGGALQTNRESDDVETQRPGFGQRRRDGSCRTT